MRRRAKDISRRRDIEDIENIKEHQEINIAVAMAYSVPTGASIKIIQTGENDLEEAVKKFIYFLF